MGNDHSSRFRHLSAFLWLALALGAVLSVPISGMAQGPGTTNGDWTFLGGDAWHTRYAPAAEINASNFEDLEVASAVVEDVGQPRQTGDGEWSIDIKFIEYRTPIPRIEPINGSEERPRRLTGNELELERNRLEIQVREAGGDDRQVARVLAEHARIQSQIGAAP